MEYYNTLTRILFTLILILNTDFLTLILVSVIILSKFNLIFNNEFIWIVVFCRTGIYKGVPWKNDTAAVKSHVYYTCQTVSEFLNNTPLIR